MSSSVSRLGRAIDQTILEKMDHGATSTPPKLPKVLWNNNQR